MFLNSPKPYVRAFPLRFLHRLSQNFPSSLSWALLRSKSKNIILIIFKIFWRLAWKHFLNYFMKFFKYFLEKVCRLCWCQFSQRFSWLNLPGTLFKYEIYLFQYLNKNISRKLLVGDCQSNPNTFNHSRMNCKFLLSSRFAFYWRNVLKSYSTEQIALVLKANTSSIASKTNQKIFLQNFYRM